MVAAFFASQQGIHYLSFLLVHTFFASQVMFYIFHTLEVVPLLWLKFIGPQK
jgi:hypothetical protein